MLSSIKLPLDDWVLQMLIWQQLFCWGTMSLKCLVSWGRSSQWIWLGLSHVPGIGGCSSSCYELTTANCVSLLFPPRFVVALGSYNPSFHMSHSKLVHMLIPEFELGLFSSFHLCLIKSSSSPLHALTAVPCPLLMSPFCWWPLHVAAQRLTTSLSPWQTN